MIDRDKFDKWIGEMPDLIATNYDPHINTKVKFWLRGILDCFTVDNVIRRDKKGTDGAVACSNCFNWKPDPLGYDLFCLKCGRMLEGAKE